MRVIGRLSAQATTLFVGAFSEHRTLPGGLSKVRHPFGLLVCYF
jgi:hypothetical protein